MTTKLLAHLDRIRGIVEKDYGPPVMVDIDPVDGVCNLDCVWCCQAASRFSRKPRFMADETMAALGKFCAQWGVKSWRIAGDSEPLLNKNIAILIQSGWDNGIEMGLITNGVYLDRLRREDLARLSWLGVSLDAARAPTWARLKRAKPQQFHSIIDQIRRVRERAPDLEVSLKFLRWEPGTCINKNDFGSEHLKAPHDEIPTGDNLAEEIEIKKLGHDLGVKVRIKDAYVAGSASQYPFTTCRATPLGGVFDATHNFHLCCDARSIFRVDRRLYSQ